MNVIKRDLESVELWGRRFETNAIKLKMNLKLKLSNNTYLDSKVNLEHFPLSFGVTLYMISNFKE